MTYYVKNWRDRPLHYARISYCPTQEDYDAWIAAQPTFAETQNIPEPDLAAGQAAYAICATCHGAQGEGNPQLNSPKIAGQQAWYLERQLKHFKEGARGGDGDKTVLPWCPWRDSCG